MKILSQDVTVSFMNYGEITIPKGTKVTHKTAMGYDPNYNFVDEFDWIDTEYPTISNILAFDAKHYGINISKEFIVEKE